MKIKKVLFVVLLISLVMMCGCKHKDKDKTDHGKKHDRKQQTEEAAQTDTDVQEDGTEEAGKKHKGLFGKEKEYEMTEEIEAIEIPDREFDVTISAVGDCALGNIYGQGYDMSLNAFFDSMGADYFLSDVKPVFEEDDMTLANLECVLSTSNDLVPKTFNIKGDPSHISILTGSSVEAVNMANNHTYDYGESGFDETKQVVEDAGLKYAYTGKTDMYETPDGVKIGLVSANMLTLEDSRITEMISEMEQLRADGAEIIVASCHWGVEKMYTPDDNQRRWAHQLVDGGADVVIGHHPHVLQGIEVYNGKVICYSLGNFCFGANQNPSDKTTVIYQQTFHLKNGQIDPKVDAKIIPCSLSSNQGYNDYHPIIAEDWLKPTIIEYMNNYSAQCGDVHFEEDGTLEAGE